MRIKPEWSVEHINLAGDLACAIKCSVDTPMGVFTGRSFVCSQSADTVKNWSGSENQRLGAVVDVVYAIREAEAGVALEMERLFGLRTSGMFSMDSPWCGEVKRVPELDIERIEKESE